MHTRDTCSLPTFRRTLSSLFSPGLGQRPDAVPLLSVPADVDALLLRPCVCALAGRDWCSAVVCGYWWSGEGVGGRQARGRVRGDRHDYLAFPRLYRYSAAAMRTSGMGRSWSQARSITMGVRAGPWPGGIGPAGIGGGRADGRRRQHQAPAVATAIMSATSALGVKTPCLLATTASSSLSASLGPVTAVPRHASRTRRRRLSKAIQGLGASSQTLAASPDTLSTLHLAHAHRLTGVIGRRALPSPVASTRAATSHAEANRGSTVAPAATTCPSGRQHCPPVRIE